MEEIKEKNWDLNRAIDFIHDHKKTKDIRSVEAFFVEKLKKTQSEEQKAEYYYHLLRCKLMKHSVFEIKECKDLYYKLLTSLKKIEKLSLEEYRKNKNSVYEDQLSAFYVTVAHYLGSLKRIYRQKSFSDSVRRTFIDEMHFTKAQFLFKREHGKFFVYTLYDITSKYGSSMGRWLLTSLFVMMVFGCLYLIADTSLDSTAMYYGTKSKHFFDYFYFSAVTFTTVGYGDISPVHLVTQILAVTEVMVGYMMLGVLVNLLGRKL